MDEANEYIALSEAHELLLDKIGQLEVGLTEYKASARWIANRLQEIENEEYDKTLTGERAV